MRNVVLVCLDAVRKDVYDEYATRLQERAAVSFEQTRAASCWSVPSHASMLTGRLASDHGVHAHNLDFSTIEGETFLDDLEEYTTIGVSANGYVSREFGFDRHFDTFSEVDFSSYTFRGLPLEKFLFENRPYPHLRDNGTKRCISQLDGAIRDAEEPFFAFLNLMEAHAPHHNVRGYDQRLHSVPDRWSSNEVDRSSVVENVEGHEEYLQNYRELYRASVDYLDRQLTGFLDRLETATDQETTVLVTADHGENLGLESDGGMFGHTSSLSEGLLHVPLSIINPPADQEIIAGGYVSHLDLPELVLGIADGQLLDVSRDVIRAESIGHAIGFASNLTYWGRMLRAVYDGQQKFVWDSLGQSSEFELDPDKPSWERLVDSKASVPSEYRDVFETDILSVKRAAAIEQAQRDTTVDEAVEERLAELGYLPE